MATPLPVVDVTPRVVDTLKAVPMARAQEGFSVSPTLLREYLVPQADDRVFRKLYVTEKLLEGNRLLIASVELFPNYQGRIFEVSVEGRTQLVMAGFSGDLGLPPVSQTLPFLVYVPPSPQDTPAAHRAANRPLYDRTKDPDVPVYYGDATGYPYAWDWLAFQHHINAHRLAHQLKWAKSPYVFVVPLVRSFADGMGPLGAPEVLEGVLLGLQRWYLDRQPPPERLHEDRLRHVVLASFSISTTILAAFLDRHRNSPFVRDSVTDLVVLDPPPGNPRNRSPIVDVALSVLRGDRRKRLLLYSQDRYYVDKVTAAITRAGLTFDPARQRLFADPRLPHVVVAYIDKALFGPAIIDPVLKDVHNTFPNLFIADAARRATLHFSERDGRQFAETSFLDWAPGR
ncbi:Arylamine N-acetyltransferase [Geodermatophilus telluris]|uniref:Arylamine N-acetyltransferase n=1 Tax=Geodermatophilus telluris TaxID=1190417 RepID=A0A1G6QIK8_9ACTN|nr:hypothetical protein [Geodermatophilus telluris]SDC92312.1 Arylamine N-acetyltransferase [Geodermatophilus telluris]